MSIDLNKNTIAAIITPDKDIIPNSENLSPAYLIFRKLRINIKMEQVVTFCTSCLHIKR